MVCCYTSTLRGAKASARSSEFPVTTIPPVQTRGQGRKDSQKIGGRERQFFNLGHTLGRFNDHDDVY